MTDFDYEPEFSKDSIMNDGDNPEFDAFLEWIQTLEDEYYSEPRAFIIDIKRLAEFKHSIYKITKFIRDIDPSAKITYEGFKADDIPVEKNGSIQIEAKQIHITDIQQFIDAIHLSSTVSILPLLRGRIRLCFGYKNLLKEMEA